jgi:thiol-disulfide isomerase/thioredoxin
MRIIRPLALSLAIAWSGIVSASVNTPAPSCSVETFDGGRALDIAQQKGKVVYVDFWASWCGPCAASFPFMNQLYGELKNKGLEVIAVNLDEDRQEAESFLEKNPPRFTVAADPDGNCPAVYGVKAMPSSYLIDKHGKIRHIHLGFKNGDKAEILGQIQSVLAEP